MALIKHSDSDVFAREAVVLDLGDLARQAQTIITNAQDQAERIIAQAKLERERLINSAHEEGFTKGREEGCQAGRREGLEQGCAQALSEHGEQLENLEQGWRKALDDFDGRRDRLLDEARTDALRLALEIARRVTHAIVERDESIAKAQLEKALSHTLEHTRLVIHIHPDDEKLISASAPGLLERFVRSAHAEIVADESLSRGDCVVHTDTGRIDARIDAQLERIAEALAPSSQQAAEVEPADDSDVQP